jgi:SsrA-binding protein
MQAKKNETQVLVGNKRAYHLYEILEKFEAGIALVGCEVKSLRAGQANLRDSFAQIRNHEVWLVNCHISPYPQGNRENPDPFRSRKLLLKKNEILRLAGKLTQKGLTLVPLAMHLKARHVKVELGLGRGKHTYDKKEDLKERIVARESDRALKNRGREA